MKRGIGRRREREGVGRRWGRKERERERNGVGRRGGERERETTKEGETSIRC